MAGLKGMKALEEWCRQVTDGYRDVNVKNMSSSFKDGLAFCAIIHHFRPDLIDFNSLSKENVYDNNKLAFETAENELGIPGLLDAVDMERMREPDRLCVMTYVSQYYNYFRKHGSEMRRRPRNVGQVKRSHDDSQQSEVEPAKRNLPIGDACEACKGKVFLLQRYIVNGKLYHRNCFRCHLCSSTLKPGAFVSSSELMGKYECRHHGDELMNRNLESTQTDTRSSSSESSGSYARRSATSDSI